MERSPAQPAIVIDLDDDAGAAGRGTPAPAAARPGRPAMGRRTPAVRVLVMLALALAVGLPPGATPSLVSAGRTVPLPSFCTGTPIPGGRLNIVQNDTFVLLDAITGTVINSGRCPHGTGTRTNDGN
ncbi:hypothetical protein ACPPVO_40850 [Dactylosporangium sp. McL0621]|uniref:hypothetical protein n=1 Tax=Dactylosporangium sp. McL0621 TaxID=3415678 RepID=UPI003CE7C161